MPSPLAFKGGPNIAMKIPPDRYDVTVAFYRDTLGLPIIRQTETTTLVEFGSIRLWLDRVATVSQAELWLEVNIEDVDGASALLAERGVVRCDEIERLPEDFSGFWIKNPAGIVHLVAKASEDGR